MPLKTTIKNDWLIREAEADELSFIYATWLNSFQSNSFLAQACRKTIFFNEYPRILDTILAKPLTKVLVAFFPDSPTVILSYLVYEPMLLHYAYTKEVYRKHGVAESLVLEAFSTPLKNNQFISFTHRTFNAEPILEKYQALLIYNPFKLYDSSKEGESHGRNQ